MKYRVCFSPEAEAQLIKLYVDLSTMASDEVAARYTDDLVTYCEGLATFPQRGSRRDDIRPGLRTIGFRKRVTIAFMVEDTQVTILGVFYGGQNFELILDS